jgi:hypothetical protein
VIAKISNLFYFELFSLEQITTTNMAWPSLSKLFLGLFIIMELILGLLLQLSELIILRGVTYIW